MSETALLHRAELFAALGDPNRIRLVEALVQRGIASISTLAAPLAITRQAVAKHLGILEEAGIVHSEKRGREVVYVVRSEEFTLTAEWLESIASNWDRRLAGIKAVAEAESNL